MKLPKFLQPDIVEVHEYEGNSVDGPQYSDAYEVEGYLEESRTYVRNTNGDEVVSSSQFYTSEEIEPPPKSKLTFNGREYIVITTSRNRNAMTGELNHIEVALE